VIAVFGSLNIDHTLCVPRIPRPGETLIAHAVHTCFGGKGANQAVAAARAGAVVHMAGCVGDDVEGKRYLSYLQEQGIGTEAIQISPDLPTGSAVIAVDERGENCIIVNPGANQAARAPELPPVDTVLLQLECPLAVVAELAESAHERGTTVVLNPSPWDDAILELSMPIDVLIMNASEADAAAGRLTAPLRIITRGAEPTLAYAGDAPPIRLAPPAVQAIDTVGAGDTFAGAFAAAHSRGMPLHEAINYANSAAALATLKPGAQA
jgi:ribokinase